MTRKPRTKIFANRESKIYHDARGNNDPCRASEIKPSNRITFDEREAAELAGYRACRRCVEVE